MSNSAGSVYTMAGITGNGKLRQWLIEQVDSGKYPGLTWEDSEKTTFRIPWKHAGKQDYNRDEDAALFKAWALFKGKYREGIDRPDPPTWKTRLRCALNKSTDFEEVVERSQLDTSDPYKVYRVIPEGTKRGYKSCEVSTITSSPNFSLYHAHTPLQSQVCNFVSPAERAWRDITPEPGPFLDIHSPYSQSTYTPHWDPGTDTICYQISGSYYNCSAYDTTPSLFSLDQCIRSAEALAFTDSRLQVCVFSGDALVRDATVLAGGGCRLAPYDEIQHYGGPGGPELVALPEVEGAGLEGGVLVWMAPDGLFARRLCEARVFWEGAYAPHTHRTGRLEKEHTSQLFDTELFLNEVQGCSLQARPLPPLQVLLYFEVCQGPQRRTITVQVEPLFARQLLLLQQTSTMPVRGQEAPPWDQQGHASASSHQPHGYGAEDWLHAVQPANQDACTRPDVPAGLRTRPAS
ncbi:interferon regulatory factor 4 isoform X3 [Brachyhypopomus gauderio]|uniref:interferon regulatory factor 4 isoform X3 n=1 Tax=Brachyhypopomus gauderio TaxID=698409 RepID=UPI0040421BAC